MRPFWLALALAGCADTTKPGAGDDDDHDHEVITSVVLDFIAQDGGDDVQATWSDPENDGSPTIDDITLASGGAYVLSVSFLNELHEPAEDLTAEVEEDGVVHQLFFTGDAVQGPATGDNPSALMTQAYGDADDNGLPLGLDNDVAVVASGNATLTVTLRHMPPEAGTAVKTEDAAATVASSGFAGLGGDSDAQVDFAVTVP